jgi:hypothetical protein
LSTYLTAKQISSLIVPILTRSIVLPGTVLRVPAGEYDGPNGGTVSVRVRDFVAARQQVTPGTQIVWDDLTETAVDVAVKHLYVATKVTDEDLTLKLADFGSQVLAPMVEGIARRSEDEIAGVMNGLAADASFLATATEADTEAKILAAREALDVANVPAGDRYFAISPDIATRVLSVSKFVRVDESGSDMALRAARIGSLYGFNFIVSNALTAGTAVAYHRSAFAQANFGPKPMANGPGVDLSTISQDGYTFRVAKQWLPDFLSMGVVLQTFSGANTLDADRAYKLDVASS